jgi:hypothetical protein
MKFFSKNNANLMIVLRQGLPGNAQLGTTTTAGLYARFQGGVVDIEDENAIALMQKHPGYNIDYVKLDDPEAGDPYESKRISAEPIHRISEMDHGQPKRVNTEQPGISPELKEFLMKTAKEMAVPMAVELSKQMLPQMVQETLKAMATQRKEESNDTFGTGLGSTSDPAPKKAGRPKKI